jgi:PilZ domain
MRVTPRGRLRGQTLKPIPDCALRTSMLACARLGTPSSGGAMATGIERRASRRFTMTLPLTVRSTGPNGAVERRGQTRDVSFRGLYFLIEANYDVGNEIEFVLTLPKEITQAGDVHIRCYGQVVRVDVLNGHRGVAARIERYEFLPAAA